MTETDRRHAALTQDQAWVLADDLIRSLTPHAGDDAAVSEVLGRWLDELDSSVLLVCAAAMRRIFADCLTHTTLDQVPPGALALTAPERTTP